MSANCSTILYRDVNSKAVTIDLFTIQNLQVTDTSLIPSKPTITGEYRNQFVTQAPLRVVFTVHLEEDKYTTINQSTKDILDKFVYLRDHRVLFNLTTSHNEQDSKFLANLVIENFNQEREASKRNRLVVKVSCIQIKLMDLKWKAASSVEIFGTNIFANDGVGTQQDAFVCKSMKEDFHLSDGNIWDVLKDSALFLSNAASLGLTGELGARSNQYDALVSGMKSLPVMAQVYVQLKDQVTFSDKTFYFRLGTPIDLSVGSRKYNCKNSFQSRYALTDANASAYNVDFLNLVVETKQNEGSLVPEIPLALVTGDKTYDAIVDKIILGVSPIQYAGKKVAQATTRDDNTTRYPYEFADTYPSIGFVINDGFDSIVPLTDLSDFVIAHQTELTQDDNTITNGNVIVDKDWTNIKTYKTSQRYNFTVTLNESFNENFVPDGGLKIITHKITSSANGLKPVIANNFQSTWDNKFSNGYTVTIAFVMLGTKVQIFLFSDAFATSLINSQ